MEFFKGRLTIRLLSGKEKLGGVLCCGSIVLLVAVAATVSCRGITETFARHLPPSCTKPFRSTELGASSVWRKRYKIPCHPEATGSISCILQRHQKKPQAFLSSWTSPPQEFSEALLSGEWHVRGQLQNAAPEVGDAAAETVRNAGGPNAAAAFLQVWRALVSGKPLSLSLSGNRLAILRVSCFSGLVAPFSYNGIWQVRGRPFFAPLVEVELGFPPENPAVILVLNAPLKSGPWVPGVPVVGQGEASLSFSPFFPWKSRRVGEVELHPKTKKATVDAFFQ